MLGCGDSTSPIPAANVRVHLDWVTGAAEAALDPITGQFRLPDPRPQFVTLAAAETLAVAVSRWLGSPYQVGNAPAVLQHDRGGAIEFSSLRQCSRATYSVSPFSEFPSSVPGFVRRSLGHHWAVPLCGADGTVQLSVGVADNPSGVRVVNGEVVLGDVDKGSEYNLVGVPYRYPSGLPLTPEQAVATVAQSTGRRASQVPVAFNQLDDRGLGQFPLALAGKLRWISRSA